jgi:hypothetical protein
MSGSGGIGAAFGLQAFGQSRAADAQEDANRKATKLEKKRLAELLPYREAGLRALGQYEGNIGQMPQYADVLAGIQDDPGYQFQLEQGMNTIQGSAAARNNLLSGRTLRGLTDFGQQLGTGYADQAYSRELGNFQNTQNQLLTLLQGGQSASGVQNALPQLALQAGQNKANFITGLSNTGTSAISNLYLNNLLQGG